MGTPCLARIIQYVDLALKSLEIVYHENMAAVEGITNRSGHIRKLVGKGKSVRCGGTWTKGEGREFKIAKKIFFHSDFLKLCLMKIQNITDFFPDTTVFYDLKTRDEKLWDKKKSTINQSYCIIHTFDLRRTLPKYLRTFLHKKAVLTIGLTDKSGYSICLLNGQNFHPHSSIEGIT